MESKKSKPRIGRMLAAAGLFIGAIFGTKQLLPEGKPSLKERAPEVHLLENPEILNNSELKAYIDENMTLEEQQEYNESLDTLIDLYCKNAKDLTDSEKNEKNSAIELLSSKEIIDFTAEICDKSVKAKISQITDTPTRNITITQEESNDKTVNINTNKKTYIHTNGFLGKKEIPKELINIIPDLDNLKNVLTAETINTQPKEKTAYEMVESYVDITNFVNDYELSLNKSGNKIEATEKEKTKTASANTNSRQEFVDSIAFNVSGEKNLNPQTESKEYSKVTQIETDAKNYSDNQEQEKDDYQL